MTKLWLTLIVIGLVTLANRLSFILILEKWEPPRLFQRSLRFVPLAVLCALMFPDLLMKNGALHPDLPHVAGGLAACLVAWFSKNIFLTIGSGMLVFYLLRFLV
jgi:branched-subunit amino acid transport protein